MYTLSGSSFLTTQLITDVVPFCFPGVFFTVPTRSKGSFYAHLIHMYYGNPGGF